MDGHCIYIFGILCAVQAGSIRRIILANEPRLFRQMLERAIKGALGLQVIGEVARSDDLVRILEHTDVQWVIMTLPSNGKIPQMAEYLLHKHPSLNILAVAPDGRNSVKKSMGSHEEIFRNLSLDELIAILREQRGKSR